jgi:hypothetical protein
MLSSARFERTCTGSAACHSLPGTCESVSHTAQTLPALTLQAPVWSPPAVQHAARSSHMLHQNRPIQVLCSYSKGRIKSSNIVHVKQFYVHYLLLLCGLYGDSHCPQQDPSQILLVSRACSNSALAQHLDTIEVRSNSSLLVYSLNKRLQ